MEQNTPPSEVSEGEPASPLEQLRNLSAEVRLLAAAELDYAKARLIYSGGVLRKAGFFALLAVSMLFAAVIGLILGLLLILATFWGPIIATLAVVLLFLTAALAFGLFARTTARKLKMDEEAADG